MFNYQSFAYTVRTFCLKTDNILFPFIHCNCERMSWFLVLSPRLTSMETFWTAKIMTYCVFQKFDIVRSVSIRFLVRRTIRV